MRIFKLNQKVKLEYTNDIPLKDEKIKIVFRYNVNSVDIAIKTLQGIKEMIELKNDNFIQGMID